VLKAITQALGLGRKLALRSIAARVPNTTPTPMLWF